MPVALVGEGVISGMSEAFVKELDAVIAGRVPKPYRWLEHGWTPNPWR